MPFYLLYFLLLFLISYLSRRGWKNQVFFSAKKYSWVVTGLSLFMFLLSADQGQLAFEVIKKGSIWTMWQFWSVMIGVFIVPIIFAPFWQRLQLSNDNEFIDLRFSGKGAAVLKTFRAYYVGMLIVSLLLSFHLLAFSKFLSVFYGLDKLSSLAIIATVLLLYSAKNIFSIKLKTDILHSAFYVIALGLLIYFAYEKSGGLFNAVSSIKVSQAEMLEIWPLNSQQIFYSLSFLCVQWWSVQIMDGGGPEMIRFKAVDSERSAILTGLSSLFFSFISSLLLLYLVLMLLSVGAEDFNSSIRSIVPAYLHPLIILGWFGLFISTCESLLLWGAAFWSDDLYKRLTAKKDTEVPAYVKLLAMIFLSILSIMAAYNAESLQVIIQWFFALSAGVAPIIFLRWFWMRINAWTQIAAMLSSPIFNLIYSQIAWRAYLPYHSGEMGEYVWRMIIMTISTLLIAFAVMFLTKSDDPAKIESFNNRLGKKGPVLQKYLLAVLLGFLYFFIWNLLLWGLVG